MIKTLIIDIETRPTLAYVWRPYKENVGVDQVVDPGGVMSFAAKWYGEPDNKTVFYSDHHDGHDVMLWRAHDLLDEADIVLHFNGKKFDIPHLQREFMENRMLPPAPYKQVDLLEVVKKQARFFMNRLAHVAPQLGLKGKVQHEGFPLWLKCMEGDEAAWKRMKRYNIRDVTELEKMYDILRPWISHPSLSAHTASDCCPKCGSFELQWRGYAYTNQTRYRRFQCKNCGGWGRSTQKGEVAHVAQIA